MDSLEGVAAVKNPRRRSCAQRLPPVLWRDLIAPFLCQNDLLSLVSTARTFRLLMRLVTRPETWGGARLLNPDYATVHWDFREIGGDGDRTKVVPVLPPAHLFDNLIQFRMTIAKRYESIGMRPAVNSVALGRFVNRIEAIRDIRHWIAARYGVGKQTLKATIKSSLEHAPDLPAAWGTYDPVRGVNVFGAKFVIADVWISIGAPMSIIEPSAIAGLAAATRRARAAREAAKVAFVQSYMAVSRQRRRRNASRAFNSDCSRRTPWRDYFAWGRDPDTVDGAAGGVGGPTAPRKRARSET